MGALDKLETLGVTAVLVGGAYLIWSKWDNITAALCRLPLASTIFGNDMCPGGPDLSCKLTMADCWKVDPRATVDTVNCTCKLPDEPHVCNPGYHFNEAGFCVPDVPPEDCGSGYRKNPQTGECEIIIVDPPCSKYNGNFGLPITCSDGSQVCDSRSCGLPEKALTLREIYESKIARFIYPSTDDCNYIRKEDPEYYALMRQRGFCFETGFGENIQRCPDGALVDLSSGISLIEACKHDLTIDQRSSCVHDLLGARAGQGSVCGSPQTVDVYINLEGWFPVPGTSCANSPLTHWAWQQCGGY